MVVDLASIPLLTCADAPPSVGPQHTCIVRSFRPGNVHQQMWLIRASASSAMCTFSAVAFWSLLLPMPARMRGWNAVLAGRRHPAHLVAHCRYYDKFLTRLRERASAKGWDPPLLGESQEVYKREIPCITRIFVISLMYLAVAARLPQLL